MSADEATGDNRCIRAKAAEHLVFSLIGAANGEVPHSTAGGQNFAADAAAYNAQPALPRFEHDLEGQEPLPICIIGAGAAGLYTAMILDSLSIPYEILDASSERVGGRLYTYRFNGEEGRNAPLNDPKRYQYFDVGAMRFPTIPFMIPVLKLFDDLHMFEDGLMIEYEFKAPHTFQYYNGIRHRDGDPTPSPDIFEVGRAAGGVVPDSLVLKGANNIITKVVEKFAKNFNNPEMSFSDAWHDLAKYDHLSMRGYLMMYEGYDEATVDWLETNTSGTGLFDLAFVQAVMDFLDFGMAAPKTHAETTCYSPKLTYDAKKEPWEKYSWWAVDGGVDHIADRMRKKIKGEVRMGHRVTKIETTDNRSVFVTFDGPTGTETKEYSQVVSTMSLGCLETVKFPKRQDLGYLKNVAIRALRYDSSAKIGLHFERRWWEDPNVMKGKPIRGGQSQSDLPIRTVVYPSYGLNTTGPAPGVMIASYSWLQDAQRLGSLIHAPGSEGDKLLIKTVLNDLADIHGISVEDMGPLLGHHGWFWDSDINARGAFAKFGPGQFGSERIGDSLYASMKTPAGANGRIHIAGEATSVHHAWVLGAINSAWRAVNNLIELRERPGLREEFYRLWPAPEEERKTGGSVLLGEMSREHPEWSL